MKNIEVFENIPQYTIISEQFSDTTEINAVAKAGNRLRRIFYISSLATLALCFNACTSTGYVETEPVYVEYVRPPQPSNIHIWINGDWVYSRQDRAFKQKSGYWYKPNHSHSYVPGHWQSSPQGLYWAPGHWQKNRH
jgi:hypothetical protein